MVDYGLLAHEIGQLIENDMVDSGLREWMIPAVAATTKHDIVIASILFIGAMQELLNYKDSLKFGLPSVTLLGEKADWTMMLKRLDKLDTL